MAFVLLAGLLCSSLGLAYSGAPSLAPRDSIDGRCGAANRDQRCDNSIGENLCCSQAGWCGDSTAHCGDGCQSAYGDCTPVVDPVVPPTTPRAKIGKVPYGTELEDCDKPGYIALTFDDGPYIYTDELLDLLEEKNVKATFFITGNNLGKGPIDSTPQWRDVIKRADKEGHQIGSHTWTHPDLSTLTENRRRYEIVRNEQAFLSIINKYPTYLRPPFISCDGACLKTLKALGYHTIIWDLDTDDYNNDSPTLIQRSKDIVRDAVQQNSYRTTDWLAIAHDIHEQTVVNLTAYFIDTARAAGYKFTTLGGCLNDPAANWYRTKL